MASTITRDASERTWPRRLPAPGTLLLALVAFVPLLATQPGQVGADTKTYLYLDPSRLLSRAAWMWDTNIGLGTVTHQNIGYLWPMGPYYWLMDTIGMPDWIAQRLWLGGIIFAAGMGIRFMLKELGWVSAGVTVASFSYALSPYLLHYGARISVILLPFAGLPWLIGISSKALRKGGWRWPAAFALITLTVGGVNATSLLLVMLGPLLWFVHSVFVSKEVRLGRAIAVGLRITFLTAITSMWWIAGLTLQGAYGIPILDYTETYFVVANAALATELARGLGYWFFYGRDALGAWLSPAERMVENLPAVVLSFALPVAAITAGVLTRFRNRGYFALIAVTGLVIGVGAHPWDSSSPFGALFGAWTETETGLAFRSTPRAIPLILLGFAVMAGAGVAALSNWRPSWRLPIAGAALLAICLNQWALFGGEMVDRNLKRDENLPEYRLEAAAAMDEGSPDTRVLETPGADFASYRWGNTVDPITPGLIDRPFAARELIPYGTPNSADLMNAFDIPLQQGSLDPESIVGMAQLLGVGTIAHRADIQYERFRTPRPRNLWHTLSGIDGLGQPSTFGDDVANEAVDILPLDDEVALGTPNDWADAPAVSLFDLEEPRAMLRTVDGSSPTVMSGDGEGIVNWAASGALDPDRPILHSASYAADTAGLVDLIETQGTQLVVTDTNRRSARRWGSVRDNDGYTERAGEAALDPDPGDSRLEKFPDATDEHFTVSEQWGGATLSASGYGNPVSYTPADRAAKAMDGSADTAWRVGAFDEVRGEFLEIDLDSPAKSSTITILQSQPPGNRWITEMAVSLDGTDPVVVSLDETSLNPPGQQIDLPSAGYSTLRLTVQEANVGVLDRYVGVSDVGIAELTIPGVEPVMEVIRPPTDLLSSAGPEAIDRGLSYVFTRRRADPAEVVVRDEEATLSRLIQEGNGRSYNLFGKAGAATDMSDETLAMILGLAPPTEAGLAVGSSAALAGDLRSRAPFALDGDPATAWQTPVNGSLGASIEIRSGETISFDSLSLDLINDGLHSIPTKLAVSADGNEPTIVDVPVAVTTQDTDRGEFSSVKVDLPEMSGSVVTVSIAELAEATSLDWFSGNKTVLPVGIAELGIGPTVILPAEGAPVDPSCRDDLIQIADKPMAVRIDGTVEQVLNGDLMEYQTCDRVEIALEQELLTTSAGHDTGYNLEQVVLASAAGGTPGPNTITSGPEPAEAAPATSVDNPSRLDWTVDVDGAQDPYWVMLGQSFSPGFSATTSDGADLGEPQLVNGYANGWLVDPAELGPDVTINITWTPQRLIWIALAASAIGVLICLLALFLPIRLLAGKPIEVVRSMRVSGIGPGYSDGNILSAGRALAWGGATGVAAWLLAGWPVGLATGIVVTVALGAKRGQTVLRVLAIASFAAASAFVVLKQFRNDYVIDFNWMNQFEITHAWTLLAFALLLADPLVSHLRARVGPQEPDADSES